MNAPQGPTLVGYVDLTPKNAPRRRGTVRSFLNKLSRPPRRRRDSEANENNTTEKDTAGGDDVIDVTDTLESDNQETLEIDTETLNPPPPPPTKGRNPRPDSPQAPKRSLFTKNADTEHPPDPVSEAEETPPDTQRQDQDVQAHGHREDLRRRRNRRDRRTRDE